MKFKPQLRHVLLAVPGFSYRTVPSCEQGRKGLSTVFAALGSGGTITKGNPCSPGPVSSADTADEGECAGAKAIGGIFLFRAKVWLQLPWATLWICLSRP